MAQIPKPYRLFFDTIDPLIAFTGILTALYLPETLLSTYSSNAITPPPVETILLLDSLAGFYAAIMFLQVVLLRARPHDLTVWKALEFSVLLTDVGILGGFARSLSKQGKLSPSHWTLEQVGTIGILFGVAAIRISFLLGIGMRRESSKKKA